MLVIASCCFALLFSPLALSQAKRPPVAASHLSVAERLGYPRDSRLLIIHADVGMMHSINRAAFEALEQGKITSATVLVPCPWFPEVAEFARKHPDIDFGIHLALNSEWRPYRWGPVLGKEAVPSLVDELGYFPPDEQQVYRRAKLDEVEREYRAQIERARAAGIKITHLDSHMSAAFGSADLYKVYRKVAASYRLPYLTVRTPAIESEIRAESMLIDREIQMRPRVPESQWLEWYKEQLHALPPGVYQMTVHLGYDDEEARGATEGRPWGAKWRQTDWDVVRSEQFQQFIKDEKFILVRWSDLSKAL